MNHPSANKTTITSKQPGEQPAKPATGDLTNKELSDGELNKVAGGTGGAGAGKVTFNEFSIKKSTDSTTPN